MTAVAVALACDRNYVRHAAAVARSVWQSDPGAHVHLLHAEDVTTEDRARFAAMARESAGEVHMHEVHRSRVEGLPVVDLFGPVMWYRTLLPDLLPGTSRVLYLDCDTWVRQSLAPLFDLAVGPAGIGAVDNVLAPDQQERVEVGLGLSGYFNSGVLLLDLDLLRETSGMRWVVDVARTRAGDLVWPDQDALNLVFAAGRVRLDPRWNAQNSFWLWRDRAVKALGPESVDAATRDPGVVHFEGPGLKPWFRDCPHPLAQAYRELAARTPWGPIKLEVPATGSPRGRVRRGLRAVRRRLRSAPGEPRRP